MENLTIFAVIALMLASVSFADTFTFQGQGVVSNINTTTTETWQIGYGSQQIATGDNMVGEILILAGCALMYIAFTQRGRSNEIN